MKRKKAQKHRGAINRSYNVWHGQAKILKMDLYLSYAKFDLDVEVFLKNDLKFVVYLKENTI